MRGNAFKKTNKHPTIPSSGHGYKSRTFEEFCHTYNALEQLWSRRQFSRGEANSPRTNRLSFACFPREWVARCSIFVSRADLRSRLWPYRKPSNQEKTVTIQLKLCVWYRWLITSLAWGALSAICWAPECCNHQHKRGNLSWLQFTMISQLPP